MPTSPPQHLRIDHTCTVNIANSACQGQFSGMFLQKNIHAIPFFSFGILKAIPGTVDMFHAFCVFHSFLRFIVNFVWMILHNRCTKNMRELVTTWWSRSTRLYLFEMQLWWSWHQHHGICLEFGKRPCPHTDQLAVPWTVWSCSWTQICTKTSLSTHWKSYVPLRRPLYSSSKGLGHCRKCACGNLHQNEVEFRMNLAHGLRKLRTFRKNKATEQQYNCKLRWRLHNENTMQ